MDEQSKPYHDDVHAETWFTPVEWIKSVAAMWLAMVM
jgi:hypothetical protein